MTRQRIIVATVLASAIGGLAGAAVTPWGGPHLWEIPVLIALVAIAELGSVQLVINRDRYNFALTDALVAMGFVLAPGWWLAVAIPLGLLVTFRRLPKLKLFFNLSNHLFSITLGVLCMTAVGTGIGAASVGLVVYAVTNYSLVTLAIAVSSGEAFHRVLVKTAYLGILHNAGNLSMGLLAGWLATNAPIGLVGLVAPFTLLWWSFEQQTQRAGEARLFEELSRGQEHVAGQSIDTSAEIVVMAAARLFGGAEVELLLRHPDGPTRYVGDERGPRSRERVEPGAFGAPWVMRALAGRKVTTGMRGGRPYCSMVLGDPERPLAVLAAHRLAAEARFTRPDEQLAQVLVGQAESWLSVADLTARHDLAMGQVEAYGAVSRVLGDLSADTAPALTQLRESTDRLSRLARAFDGPDPVRQIVDELHAVERAVASLLGAIRFATDEDLAGSAHPRADQLPPTSPHTEWTTTGRLDTQYGR